VSAAALLSINDLETSTAREIFWSVLHTWCAILVLNFLGTVATIHAAHKVGIRLILGIALLTITVALGFALDASRTGKDVGQALGVYCCGVVLLMYGREGAEILSLSCYVACIVNTTLYYF
jgi:hypothetical protein